MNIRVQGRNTRHCGLSLLTLLLASVFWLAPVRGQAATTPAAADTYVLRVDGLACPYCAYGIEKQFSGMQGVTGTNVDIGKGVVIVHVKPGTQYTTQQINSAVNDAGFTLNKVVSTPSQTQ